MPITRKTRLSLLAAVLAVFAGTGAWWLAMPGVSFHGAAGPASDSEKLLSESLKHDVKMLSETIGERHMFKPTGMRQAANWVAERFEEGGFKPDRQSFKVRKVDCENIEAAIAGSTRAHETIVVGAHYDSTPGSPAANDNASGVAVLLALAEMANRTRPQCTLRFVAFTNEELAFQTEGMGSLEYARRLKARNENVVGMIALDTVGTYTDAPESQAYPVPWLRWFFPGTGNFVSFVANPGSRGWLTDVVGAFRQGARLPSEGAAVPESVPGSAWSDHWAFWQVGYPALLVSDTAPFRDSTYHTAKDTAEHINYVALARLTEGLSGAIGRLASK